MPFDQVQGSSKFLEPPICPLGDIARRAFFYALPLPRLGLDNRVEGPCINYSRGRANGS